MAFGYPRTYTCPVCCRDGHYRTAPGKPCADCQRPDPMFDDPPEAGPMEADGTLYGENVEGWWT